ncbi:uncharacterized protein LOC34620428 [Cyclospora cayetanensis]|uniref:Uncharacterized protein LOC34620428 n=1 Tax=Cyclospora cayetanensis TaxID=88456 RepID=A0A6P6S0I4_9EIME|nr:uncharacterized protein LOC34620428 [Cyclospora cayetanensis]
MERAHPAEFPSPSSFDPLSSPSRFCEPPAVPTLASLSSDASHGNVPAADEEASDAEEDLPCCRLSLPVHLALDRSKVIADFNRPHEGFSLYAAFSESAFALAAEGSLNQQQIADLHKLFQTVTFPPFPTPPLFSSPRSATTPVRRREGQWAVLRSLLAGGRTAKAPCSLEALQGGMLPLSDEVHSFLPPCLQRNGERLRASASFSMCPRYSAPGVPLRVQTLESELLNCVRAVFACSSDKSQGKRKRQRGAPGTWCLKGSLVSYRREGRRMQMIVKRASLQTQGLVLPAEQLVLSALDSS